MLKGEIKYFSSDKFLGGMEFEKCWIVAMVIQTSCVADDKNKMAALPLVMKWIDCIILLSATLNKLLLFMIIFFI